MGLTIVKIMTVCAHFLFEGHFCFTCVYFITLILVTQGHLTWGSLLDQHVFRQKGTQSTEKPMQSQVDYTLDYTLYKPLTKRQRRPMVTESNSKSKECFAFCALCYLSC